MTYPWLNESREDFARRLAGGRLPHACLVTGPRGLGKIRLAREMAAMMLCQQQGTRACGSCRSCQLLASGAHPDFRLLTFEVNENNGKMRTELVIEQVRSLNAAMQLTHSISPRKVALIYPAEAMNRNTSNALLKTLEEPPGDAVLLLVAHDPSRLPATIRSRCQTLHIRLPDARQALDWLVDSEGADERSAGIALQASAGSPLQAQQMLTRGDLEQYCAIETALERVQADETAVGELLERWSGLDQEALWNWLSLISARRVRTRFSAACAQPAEHTEAAADPGAAHDARRLLQLQTLADYNRRALATSLRKELLLRDWLIQWAQLGGS